MRDEDTDFPSARTVGGTPRRRRFYTLGVRTPLARHLIGLALLAAIGGAVALVGFAQFQRHNRTPTAPLEISLWYWHSPFRLSGQESERLRGLNIRALFVRAGTIERGENGVCATLPQVWQTSPNAPAVHLVFNFDYSMVRHFAELDNANIASVVAATEKQAKAKAEAVGLRIIGVQLDFDCATKRLPKYADLLRRVRAALPRPELKLSITALQTWYVSGDLSAVLDAVDFAAPQFYEANLADSITHFEPVSNIKRTARALEKADSFGKPFYAGLPAYGHAVMTDDRGKVIGLYREMTVDEAATHPAFQFVRAFPADRNGQPTTAKSAIGENLVDFVAVRNARDGRGKGYHLIYDLPTPELLAQHLALVERNRPPNCRGVILFRYPEPGATMTLPLPALTAVLQKRPAMPDIKLNVQCAASPWELIETGRKANRPPLDVTVSVANCGNSDTFFAPDGLTLNLIFDKAGMEESAAPAFDRTETFAASSDSAAKIRCSAARANEIQLSKRHLAPGETVKINLRLPADGATTLRGDWTLRNPDGLTTRTGEVHANLSTK